MKKFQLTRGSCFFQTRCTGLCLLRGGLNRRIFFPIKLHRLAVALWKYLKSLKTYYWLIQLTAILGYVLLIHTISIVHHQVWDSLSSCNCIQKFPIGLTKYKSHNFILKANLPMHVITLVVAYKCITQVMIFVLLFFACVYFFYVSFRCSNSSFLPIMICCFLYHIKMGHITGIPVIRL